MTNRWSVFAALFLLVTVAWAGCIGDASDPVDIQRQMEQEAREREAAEPTFEVDERLPVGSVEGRVVTDEQLPIPNATVHIVGAQAFARTTSAGEFRLTRVNTGDYFLKVEASGFLTRNVGISVHADETTQVTVELEAVAAPVARIDEAYVFEGYISGGVCVAAAETCQLLGAGGSVTPEDVRTERSDHVPLEAGWTSVLIEVEWEATTNLGTHPALEWVVCRRPTPSSAGCSYNHVVQTFEGASPLVVRVDAEDMERLMEEDSEIRAPRPEGTGRIAFNMMVHPGSSAASLHLDQRFTVFGTVAYRMEMPDEYSRLG